MTLIKNTLANFKYNLKDLLFFEILYKLITMIFFIPINQYVYKQSLLQIGKLHLSNKDILRFSLSTLGSVGLFIIIFVCLLGILIELFILIQFANRSHHKQSVKVFSDILNTLNVIFHNINLYFFLLVLLCGVIGTLIGVSLFSTLIRELRLPSLFISTLSTSLIGSLILLIGLIVLIFLIMRWFLTIPIYLIEEVSLKTAFHHSAILDQHHKRKVTFSLLGILCFNVILKISLLFAYLLVGNAIFSFDKIDSNVFMLLYLIFFMIGYLLLSLVTLPIFTSFLTELYYTCATYKVKQRFTSSLFKSLYPSRDKILKIIILLTFCMMIGVSTSSIWFSLGKTIPQITAHRGSSLKAPENTYASIVKAIEDSVPYAEIDVTLTKDGHVVLFHDKTLKRVNGSKAKIKNLTLAQLQDIDVGSYFNVSFNQERIPTLDEILLLAKGKIKLNIELKTYGDEVDLPLKVANLIKKYNMEEDVIVSSMDYSAAIRFKSLAPFVDVGYIITDDLYDLTSLNVDFVSIQYRYLSKELLYAMHALDKDVHVWTVNEQSQAKRAALLGVDHIITDNVEGVKLVFKNEYDQSKNLIVLLYDGVSSIIRRLKI